MNEAEKQTTEFMTKIEGDNSKGYSLTILLKEDNSLIDISELVGDITHTTSLLDSPERLEFFIQKDPNKILNTVRNGDKVFFKKNGIGIFCGYVFTVGFDANDVFKITAYSQTRYLKNETNLIVKNKTVSQIFEQICIENKIKNYAIKTPIDFVQPSKTFMGKTLYSILRDCLINAQIDAKKKGNTMIYMIRDNYGVLELTSIDKFKTNVEIGLESLLCSFQFETSIDKGTYNSFKLTKKAKEATLYTTQIPDSASIDKWGLLQKVVEVDENMNEAQVKEKAENLMRLYCRETKSLTLSAIGLLGFNAGVGFTLNIPQLGDKIDMYIVEASHRYSQDFHTMDLTVNANDLEIYFK